MMNVLIHLHISMSTSWSGQVDCLFGLFLIDGKHIFYLQTCWEKKQQKEQYNIYLVIFNLWGGLQRVEL